MLPIGPLMIEHRVTERMVALLKAEMEIISKTNKTNPDFLLSAVDFLKTYVDRCHHGKEEDILFTELENKNIETKFRDVIGELKAEHKKARGLVLSLQEARQKYLDDDPGSSPTIHGILSELTELYPRHIEKEDKHFFFPAMEYFSKKEQLDMIDRFLEFDEQLIHRIYRDIVEGYENKGQAPAGQGMKKQVEG